MKIGVCTTLAAYAMEPLETWASWIGNQEAMRTEAREYDATLHYFAAIELDARGIKPFTPLIDAMGSDFEGKSEYWTYLLDDARTEITTANRLRHLTMGQNLAVEWCTARGMDWMLFLAADTQAPNDVVPRLLELNHPLCGAEISTYCLNGTAVPGYPFPVQEQLISAACIFVRRDVFKVLRWRSDPDTGTTDDPSYRRDAETLLGVKSYVRKDCVAKHYPEAVCAIEYRFHRDMRVYR